jgi:membrane associated rhomboid family serine protease
MRRQYRTQDFSYFLKRGYIPVTKILIGICVVAFLFDLLFAQTGILGAFVQTIAFQSPGWLLRPWTLVTYPAMTSGAINLLFACVMLWMFGGSLERAWSSRVYAWFFVIISAITALSLAVASFLTNLPVSLLGIWMPLSAITVAWASLNPEVEILLMFVLPVKAKFVGYATAAVVAWSFAWNSNYPSPYNLIFAVFSLGGCVAAWRYVHLRWAAPSRPRTPVIRINRYWLRRFNPFFQLKEKQEQKRLRKLFGEDRNDKDRWR